MLVKLLTSRATIRDVQNRGDEIEVDDDEAVRMIDAGQAVPVVDLQPGKETRRAASRPEA